MIFITLGSQKFQFNRILKKIDQLFDEKKLSNEVFAQIGYSDYKPKNFKFKEFLDQNEFQKYMENCDLVITHGGTGAIITALKHQKKVIGIPRLSKYDEHVDDHQMQIVNEFTKMNLIEGCFDVKDLENAIEFVSNKTYNKFYSNTNEIIRCIEGFIQEI